MKKNILAGQSGGPTAVINASLYGIIHGSLSHASDIGHVYGMLYGIEGFMQGKYMNLSEELSENDLELLKYTPAAYLGSCRFKLPSDLNDPFYPEIFKKFEALDIGYFLYIGGNDSMDTVSRLSAYAAQSGSDIRFIGIPKTIDNDLVMTDHTPGYGSAAKYVASTVREITLDASVYQQKAVTIVEIMGRHAGWLTAAAALARKDYGDNPLLLYLPESDFELEQFKRDVQKCLETHSAVVVCVSEGISDSEGRFVCEYADTAKLDTFGHKMLTGCGKVLEDYLKSELGIKVRSVELNVSQRCSGLIASLTDTEEAKRAGEEAVKAALAGESGKMICFKRTGEPSEDYTISYETEDVSRICNLEKPFPAEWITKDGTDISEQFTAYASPLIRGEIEHVTKDGLPLYLYRKQS